MTQSRFSIFRATFLTVLLLKTAQAQVQCFMNYCYSDCNQDDHMKDTAVTCSGETCDYAAVFDNSGGVMMFFRDCGSNETTSLGCVDVTTVDVRALNQTAVLCSCNNTLCNNKAIPRPLITDVTTFTFAASSLLSPTATAAAAETNSTQRTGSTIASLLSSTQPLTTGSSSIVTANQGNVTTAIVAVRRNTASLCRSRNDAVVFGFLPIIVAIFQNADWRA